MRPVDMIPGFAPTRTEIKTETGWKIHVKPPGFMRSNGCTVELTDEQFKRYRRWRDGVVMIQDALPELTPSEREALMSGLNDAEFEKAFKEEFGDD